MKTSEAGSTKKIVRVTAVNNSTRLHTTWYNATKMVHPKNRAERLALAKKKHGKKSPYPRRPTEEEDEDAIREEVRREVWDRQDG